MSHDPSADSQRCRRLALRHLRAVSIIYLIALIVGMHWPRLDMGGPAGSFDKLIHFYAFGLMVFCFWISGWVTGFFPLVGIGIGVCFLIEITQATLSVGRTYSLHDVEAGVMGVIGFAAMIQALGPVHGVRGEEIRTLWARIAFSLIARPGACLVILTTGSVGVLLGGSMAIAIDFIMLRSRGVEGSNAMVALILGGLALGGPAMLLAFRSGFRFESKRLGQVEKLDCLESWFRSTFRSSFIPASLCFMGMWLFLLVFERLIWNRLAAESFLEMLVFEEQGTLLSLILALGTAIYLRLLLKNLARRI